MVLIILIHFNGFIYTVDSVGGCGGQKCHLYASCHAEPDTGKESCRCQIGFTGNGLECTGYSLSLLGCVKCGASHEMKKKMQFGSTVGSTLNLASNQIQSINETLDQREF